MFFAMPVVVFQVIAQVFQGIKLDLQVFKLRKTLRNRVS
ncbi:hypothetical protein CRENPOLYSF2_3450001 [Crenothrix polyspora]|uniref:Uncharacterized protein n=1 Tax=Crenothrix polyspora TaxID=360316 RepID=A0A1R4HCK6_9GAMM|nr:hypothetical protein CRENPOLYSF2_3450001 [Crenothrix polyspora]